MSKVCQSPATVDTRNEEDHHYQRSQDENIELSPIHSTESPPAEAEGIKYKPFSIPVVALLIPSSILGVLARLGLLAMTSYDGESIFPLAYVQAVGCLTMGLGLRLKEPIAQL